MPIDSNLLSTLFRDPSKKEPFSMEKALPILWISLKISWGRGTDSLWLGQETWQNKLFPKFGHGFGSGWLGLLNCHYSADALGVCESRRPHLPVGGTP